MATQYVYYVSYGFCFRQQHGLGKVYEHVSQKPITRKEDIQAIEEILKSKLNDIYSHLDAIPEIFITNFILLRAEEVDKTNESTS